MTSHPNHLQDSGAAIQEPNALDALSSIGADIAEYGAYAIIFGSIFIFWIIT